MVINMNIGGTEKALLNMISELSKEKYDITVLMLEETGGFLSSLPNHVTVEAIECYGEFRDLLHNPPRLSIIQLFKNGQRCRAINFTWHYLLSKLFNNNTFLFKYLLKKVSKHNEEYDYAIAYAGPMDFISYYVLNKLTAIQKIQWIHFDVTKIGFNRKQAEKYYKKFNKVFVVSEEGRQKLVSLIPSIDKKTEVFKNGISPQLIHRQAKEGAGFNDKFDGIRILTVGRLTGEKGQDLAIKSLSRLIKEGHNVRWYCIGDGSSRETYEKLVEEHGLHNQFIFLGAKTNPYPYMDQCDIYVQPSRHEGYCITLAEAKCLNKPIVTTCFTGAQEQIKNNKTGIIVNPDDFRIYQALTYLIVDSKIRKQLSENLYKDNKLPKLQEQELNSAFSHSI